MAVISGVSKPLHNKQRGSWQIRWREDGIPRSKSGFSERAAAEEFRRTLTGQAPAEPKMPAAPVRVPRPRLDAPGVDSAIEQAWQDDLLYYRQKIRSAFDARDDGQLDLAARAARAVGTLVTAHANNRDMRRLRAKLDELEAWRESLTAAGTHGTRIDVDATRQSGSAVGESLYPEDSIH